MSGFVQSSEVAPLALAYVNLRQNQISKFAELDKINTPHLPALKHVVLMGNPIAGEEVYRLETLFRLPKIGRLDKDVILEEDREEVEAVSRSRDLAFSLNPSTSTKTIGREIPQQTSPAIPQR